MAATRFPDRLTRAPSPIVMRSIVFSIARTDGVLQRLRRAERFAELDGCPDDRLAVGELE